jgi:tRNA modification GTPase
VTGKARARAVVLTPPGQGAVALIALSGADAGPVLGRLLENGAPPPAGRMRHVWLRSRAGERLDDALVVGLPPAAAVSGEPTWELGVHGGPAVVDAVLDALTAAGAGRAEWKHLLEEGRRRERLDPIRAAALRRMGRVVSRRGAEVLAFA